MEQSPWNHSMRCVWFWLKNATQRNFSEKASVKCTFVSASLKADNINMSNGTINSGCSYFSLKLYIHSNNARYYNLVPTPKCSKYVCHTEKVVMPEIVKMCLVGYRFSIERAHHICQYQVGQSPHGFMATVFRIPGSLTWYSLWRPTTSCPWQAKIPITKTIQYLG